MSTEDSSKQEIDGSYNAQASGGSHSAVNVQNNYFGSSESSRVGAFPGHTISSYYLPAFNPDLFVGRRDYLEKLEAWSAATGMFLLSGGPGCGKSTLAQMFAWRMQEQKKFEAIVFQTCGERPIETIVGDMASTLREHLGDSIIQAPVEQKLGAAKRWLQQRQSLLVLDDVWLKQVHAVTDGPSLKLQDLLPGPGVSVLWTSRQPALAWVDSKHSLALDAFTPEEVEQNFRLYLSDATVDGYRGDLLGFAEKVQRLPIAVSVAAHLLRSALGPVDKAAQELKLAQLQSEIHDVPALLQHAIEAQGAEERKLLRAAAVCTLESFWLPLAIEIAGLSQEQGRQAAKELVNAGLLRVVNQERQRVNLHALVREQAGSDEQTTLQEAHAQVLKEIFKDWERRWRDCRECLAEIIPAVQFLHEKKAGDGEGLSYYGYATASRIGELDTALQIERENERLWSGREGQNAKDGLQRSYGNQALILQDWGRLEEAMALLQQQEALCLELGNKDSLQRSYGNQAVVLRDWGRLEEAMTLHKQQEVLFLELGDKNNLQAGYENQAVILRDWGRLEEAMTLHKKQEAICLELGNKRDLQAGYGNQGVILHDWGRLEEAMALFKRKEAICLELGDKSSLQSGYGNQAVILHDWGRLEEAMALLKKQEAVCLELGNKDSLQRSYGNQAVILHEWGRLEEAMALIKQQEAICLELGNKDSLQGSYGNQAVILREWGRLGEAMALEKKAEAICLELGDKNGLQASYGNQALILKAWGRLEEAMALHKKEEAICLELGNKSGLAYCYWNWGGLAGEMKDTKTAEEKLRRALAIFTELKMPRQRDGVEKAMLSLSRNRKGQK